MQTNKKYKPGTQVLVQILLDGQTNNPAAKLNGQVFELKSKHHVTPFKWYWELDGAVSDEGVPYGFLEEELFIV